MVIKMKQSQKVTGPHDYFSLVSLQSTLVYGLQDAVFKTGLDSYAGNVGAISNLGSTSEIHS